MIKIMFVCYGNICRSPMAEFMMKDIIKKEGKEKDFLIKSSATSYEEVGNPIHRGTRGVLNRLGIDCSGKISQKLKAEDYDKYDYFIGMDKNNYYSMQRIFSGDPKNKISLLLDYTITPRDVADPYWTGDFSATERDVSDGVRSLYEYLTKK